MTEPLKVEQNEQTVIMLETTASQMFVWTVDK